MKSTKKLEEVLHKLDIIESVSLDSANAASYAAECKKLIREVIADNLPDVKKSELHCKDFVSKDPNRQLLHYVYHDNEKQVAVATDAHILFTSEAEYIPTEGNGLRDIYGEVTGETKTIAKYPNWQSVMPKAKDLVDVTVRSDLAEILKQATANRKDKKQKVYVCVDGMHWFAERMVKTILKTGIDGWHAVTDYNKDTTAPHRPLYKKWDGKQLLLMPVSPPENENEILQGWYIGN